jgi:hypothetical protein
MELQQRILAFINGATDDFDALALEVFAFQYERNPIYRAYCDRQPPVKHWKDIPAVPTSAFKDFAITCFPVEEAVAVFHTSGTTRDKAGKHYFKTLELYEAAARPNFVKHLGNLPALSLIPTDPHSSLAYMVREAQPFRTDVTEPVIVLGTAFGFMNHFDAGTRAKFPPGSRAMETGGYKGRSREVPKRELHRLIRERLGIEHVINEYGMTELSTQFYDERPGSDIKDVPHWSRVLIIDPTTGNEARPGERGPSPRRSGFGHAGGLIRIFDLANLWSAMCIQTEDLGIGYEDGRFEVLGRAAGAEVRGCSLNAESLRSP